MALDAKRSEFKRDPVPAGAHHAVCVGLFDLGVQPPSNPTYRPSQRVMIMWEIPDERFEFEKDGEKINLPRTMTKEFTRSFGGSKKPTQLRTFLESWRGRQFTEDELDRFDLRNVLGTNCLLTVIHATTPNGVYANVHAVAPLIKQMTKRTPESKVIAFDLDEMPDGPMHWPDEVPPWIRKKIEKSAEYMQRFGAASADNHGGGDEAPAPDDDDIPF